MGIRLLNLNNYTSVTDMEDATLRIRPLILDNGTQLPDILLRGTKKQKNPGVTLADVKSCNVQWNPSVKISEKGTPEEYGELVYWWFDEAAKNRGYANSINDRFEIIGDVLSSVLSAKAWLVDVAAYQVGGTGDFFKRKNDINKFLTGWLTREKKRTLRSK